MKNSFRKLTLVGAVAGATLSAPIMASPFLELSVLGRYMPAGDVFDEAAAEIVKYDAAGQRLFVVNSNAATVDVLSIADPTNPVLTDTLDASAEGAAANSVAIHGDMVAVAIEAENTQSAGKVVVYNSRTLRKAAEFDTGALPDMLTFTASGDYLLVANEGEPSSDYQNDPEGSVTIIDLRRGLANARVRTADFRAFNSRANELAASGVRIFGPGASVAQDLEPEYIAVSADDRTAWVALQENNAVAVVDIARATVTDILPLGFKDHRIIGNELDASNRDDRINIRNWPVMGMYQPDAMKSYVVNGQTYYITANEGDARDYDAFTEEARVADLQLDPDAFPDAEWLQQDENLGRLNITTTLGMANPDECQPSAPRDSADDVVAHVESVCVYSTLYSYGARSVAIWNEAGEQIWDSGSQLEQITAQRHPAMFNTTNDENAFDNRSDDKGPEPEAVEVGVIDGAQFAFVGLERMGGIVVFNVSNPQSPTFVSYLNTRDLLASQDDIESGAAGDLGPEDITFIPAVDSPSGRPMLAVGNEVSGTTTLFDISVFH